MIPKVGDKAPSFSLPSSSGGVVSLESLRGKKVVLYFYPKDDTPGCTKEACSFRDNSESLDAANIKVLGVSADNVDSHNQFIDKYGLNFQLLSDTENVVSNAYGAWGEKTYMGRTTIGIKRMTFLIDEEGVISEVWPTVRPEEHATEVIEAAKKQ